MEKYFAKSVGTLLLSLTARYVTNTNRGAQSTLKFKAFYIVFN